MEVYMTRWRFLLTAALVALCVGRAGANTDIVVVPAELAVSFQAAPGRVVLAGDQILFWSDSQAHPSFYCAKSAVSRSSITSGVLTIELGDAIPIQDGRRSRFEFRLIGEADVVAIERWFNMPVSSSAPAASTSASQVSQATSGAGMVEGLSYLAEHHKRFGRNSSGKLVFGTSSIIWESLDDATDSRTWEYKSVKRLDRKNPYEVVVDTFNDGKYSFKMTGQPVGNEDFVKITDLLTAARAGARQ